MKPDLLETLGRSIAPHGNTRTVIAALALTAMVLTVGCVTVTEALPFTKPAPYTESGAELDGSDLRADHLSGLNESDSYRSNSTLVLQSGGTTFEVNRSAAVEESANRSLSTTQYNSAAIDGDGLVASTYTADNTTYRQIQLNVAQNTVTRYDAAREPYHDGFLAVQPVSDSETAYADLVTKVADDVDWTMVGVERYEGEWVTRYEASGSENFSAIGSTAMAEGQGDAADASQLPENVDLDVSSINATLLVTPDGVVRLFELHAEGNAGGHPVELSLTVEIDDIGATSVEEPSWLEAARDQTSG